MTNPIDIKRQMSLLDIRPNDFQNCSNLQEEFTTIQRKSGDLKAFCGPSEMGYASRIRAINAAQRALQDLYETGSIDSFSRYLCDNEMNEHKEESDQESNEVDENNDMDSELRFQ